MRRRDVFQAIADPTRREIINLIARQVLTLNGVAESFQTSRQAVSKHIKILAECGLVEMQQQGRERLCVVRPESLAEVEDWLQDFRTLWESRFKRLDALLAKRQLARGTKAKRS
jgi:DNA-binding transcriptional ArsR family regulator